MSTSEPKYCISKNRSWLCGRESPTRDNQADANGDERSLRLKQPGSASSNSPFPRLARTLRPHSFISSPSWTKSPSWTSSPVKENWKIPWSPTVINPLASSAKAALPRKRNKGASSWKRTPLLSLNRSHKPRSLSFSSIFGMETEESSDASRCEELTEEVEIGLAHEHNKRTLHARNTIFMKRPFSPSRFRF